MLLNDKFPNQHTKVTINNPKYLIVSLVYIWRKIILLKVRIKRYRIDETLFPKNIKKGLREDYLIKALTYILENGIEVWDGK